jgi:hypothetical protein
LPAATQARRINEYHALTGSRRESEQTNPRDVPVPKKSREIEAVKALQPSNSPIIFASYAEIATRLFVLEHSIAPFDQPFELAFCGADRSFRTDTCAIGMTDDKQGLCSAVGQGGRAEVEVIDLAWCGTGPNRVGNVFLFNK